MTRVRPSDLGAAYQEQIEAALGRHPTLVAAARTKTTKHTAPAGAPVTMVCHRCGVLIVARSDGVMEDRITEHATATGHTRYHDARIGA